MTDEFEFDYPVMEAVERLVQDVEFAPFTERFRSDFEIVLNAYARLKYGPPHLIQLRAMGKWRVKWRDAASVMQDADFDTEVEARAFGATLSATRLEFGSYGFNDLVCDQGPDAGRVVIDRASR